MSEIDDSPRIKSAVVKVKTTGSSVLPRRNTELAVTELFPNPPRRISRLVDVDLFARKPSNRGKHSSDRRTFVSKAKTGRDKRFATAPLSGVVRKIKDRLGKIPQPKRVVEILAKNQPIKRRQSNQKPPLQVTIPAEPVNSTEPSSVRRLYVIPKVTKDAVTQTDVTGPCRCVNRNRNKNKNRRKTAQENRDLVAQFNLR